MNHSHKIRPSERARGMPSSSFIMPKFWFQVGKVSDRKGIEARMKVIPKELQQKVANEYDRIFLQVNRHKGRLEANKFLHETAMKYLENKNAPEGA